MVRIGVEPVDEPLRCKIENRNTRSSPGGIARRQTALEGRHWLLRHSDYSVPHGMPRSDERFNNRYLKVMYISPIVITTTHQPDNLRLPKLTRRPSASRKSRHLPLLRAGSFAVFSTGSLFAFSLNMGEKESLVSGYACPRAR